MVFCRKDPEKFVDCTTFWVNLSFILYNSRTDSKMTSVQGNSI